MGPERPGRGCGLDGAKARDYGEAAGGILAAEARGPSLRRAEGMGFSVQRAAVATATGDSGKEAPGRVQFDDAKGVTVHGAAGVGVAAGSSCQPAQARPLT
jgi:hypothetical protein